MQGGNPTRQIKIRDGGSNISPLSNWPKYLGGVIAGALVAVVSVLMFLFDSPATRQYLLVAGIVVVVLWALFACRSSDSD
jgi:hypothetical protein